MAWVTQNPEVIHTELEDGAVLLNMMTGFYYSLDAVGLEIWRLLERTPSAEQLGAALADRFEVSPDRATAVSSAFVDELRQEELVVEQDPSESAAWETEATNPDGAGGTAAGGGTRRPFAEPALLKHEEPLSRITTHPFDPQLPLAE